MGTIFRLIADEALEPLDDYYTHCQVCERRDVLLYPIQATPRGAPDGDDRYAACQDCLATGNLIPILEKWSSGILKDHLRRYSPTTDEAWIEQRANKLIEQIRRTPKQVAFAHDLYSDWPLCCGWLAEFIGHPNSEEAFIDIIETAIYVDRNVRYDPKDQMSWGLFFEGIDDVSVFCCKECGQRYWTLWYS